MPKLDGILETALYTDDMARARSFYEGVLDLQPIFSDARLTRLRHRAPQRSSHLQARQPRPRPSPCRAAPFRATTAPGRCMSPSPSARTSSRSGSSIWPPSGIAVEGTTTWSRGGRSIYFRDPDGHLLELATPGLWTVY